MNYKVTEKRMIDRRGFTIIELLIAMATFSFILLLTTIVLINIGGLYSKGVNQTKIDDATRYIADEISNKLRYSSVSSLQEAPDSDRLPETGAYCVGGYKYSYSSRSDPSPNFLRKIPLPTGTACKYEDSDQSSGISLLPANTKLTYFNVELATSGSTNYFKIKTSLLYGNFNNANLSDYSTTCKTGSEYTYCAVSRLETVVTARLN